MHKIKVANASPAMLESLRKTGKLTPCQRYFEVTSEQLAALPIVTNHPSEKWPGWAVIAALFADDADKGVGDTLARELGGDRSEAFKRHNEAVFGVFAKPCGCSGKVSRWNAKYPYS